MWQHISLEFKHPSQPLWAYPPMTLMRPSWLYGSSALCIVLMARDTTWRRTCLTSAPNRSLLSFLRNLPVIDSPPPFPYLSPNACSTNFRSFVPVSPGCQSKRPCHALHQRQKNLHRTKKHIISSAQPRWSSQNQCTISLAYLISGSNP